MRHLNHASDHDHDVPAFNLRDQLRSEWGFIKLAYRRNPQVAFACIGVPVLVLASVFLNCHS